MSTINKVPLHVGASEQGTYKIPGSKLREVISAKTRKELAPFEYLMRRRRASKSSKSQDSEAQLLGEAAVRSGTNQAPGIQWFRSEPGPALDKAPALRSPLPIAPHQRLLVGGSGQSAQARIQIEAGKLAGVEICVAMVGTRIEAQVLALDLASRQTLVSAMAAAKERLRERNQVNAATNPSSRAGQNERQRYDDDRRFSPSQPPHSPNP